MINVRRARQLLKQAMETQGPDFVYAQDGSRCFYEPVTQDHIAHHLIPSQDNRRLTGCIVGVALDIEGLTFQHGSTQNIGALAFNNFTQITPEAGEYFKIAQKLQDNGNSWGAAFNAAELEAEFLEEQEHERELAAMGK